MVRKGIPPGKGRRKVPVSWGGGQVRLRLPGGRCSVCAAPAPRRGCSVELVFSFLLSQCPVLPLPKTALPLRSVRAPPAGDPTCAVFQTAHSTRRWLCPRASPSGRGQGQCQLWGLGEEVHRGDNARPRTWLHSSLPSPLQLQGEDRLGSAALPQPRDSPVFSSSHPRRGQNPHDQPRLPQSALLSSCDSNRPVSHKHKK